MNGEFSQGEFQGKVLQKLQNIEEALLHKVDREEFTPVKAIAFGMVGIILTVVMGAILATVVKAAENLIK